jgi:branched-chain amino acid transport system ATP-binding protein
MESILEVRDLKVNYGMINALKGISFEVYKGEIVSLIGANGAGKTTTLHTMTGLIDAKSGEVIYHYRDKKSGTETAVNLMRTPGDKIVKLGIAHVPEGRRVFSDMTVLQNLKLGAYTRSDNAELEQTLEEVYLKFPRLKERRTQKAGTLSGGEQQMLAMGRALMSHPDVILLDEPSMGLSPLLVKEVFEIIKDIHSRGTTVLLVEQNAKMALGISDRAYVLETGSITLTGKGDELLGNKKIQDAYLGGGQE